MIENKIGRFSVHIGADNQFVENLRLSGIMRHHIGHDQDETIVPEIIKKVAGPEYLPAGLLHVIEIYRVVDMAEGVHFIAAD